MHRHTLTKTTGRGYLHEFNSVPTRPNGDKSERRACFQHGEWPAISPQISCIAVRAKKNTDHRACWHRLFRFEPGSSPARIQQPRLGRMHAVRDNPGIRSGCGPLAGVNSYESQTLCIFVISQCNLLFEAQHEKVRLRKLTVWISI